jgi:hypothetical protein
MREVLPGIFHWTTMHDPISVRVSSYYVEPAGIVIDPKVPEGGFAELPGRPQQVVLTSGHHRRDSAAFADEYGIPIRASQAAAERLGPDVDAQTFGEGEELAAGVTALHVGVLCPDEDALQIAVAEGAIAFADSLIRYADELSFVPDELLGDEPEAVKAGLKQRFEGLLTRDFDHLLFAHGDPLVGGGRDALRRFATS